MSYHGECSSSSSSSTRLRRLSESPSEFGILDERILVLVFRSMRWDIRTLCQMASVNRRLRALAKRLLWRELCLHRAGRMMSALSDRGGRIIGGWHTMAKLLFFCGGCESTRHFAMSRPAPGHFVESIRFSKTSGRSFLPRRCRDDDVLYVTDPCEHRTAEDGDEVGIYRGVFRSFTKSRTRECLIRRGAEFEEGVRCPYCGTRMWSMTAARLIPKKSVARRLGSNDGAIEYFVCLNGHLHGMCWLVSLTSDENTDGEDQRLRYVGSSNDDECD